MDGWGLCPADNETAALRTTVPPCGGDTAHCLHVQGDETEMRGGDISCAKLRRPEVVVREDRNIGENSYGVHLAAFQFSSKLCGLNSW